MGLLNQHRGRVSQEYLQFLDAHPDGCIGDLVVLYGRDEIDERNEAYQAQTYEPEAIAVGDDSGGRAILLRLDGSNDVYLCGHGALGSSEFELLSDSFERWFQDGCPLPEEEESTLPLHGDLWLIASPAGGLKDLLRLKNLLSLPNSLGDLKKSMTQIPCVLAENIPPIAFSKRLAGEAELARIVSFSDRGSKTVSYRVE